MPSICFINKFLSVVTKPRAPQKKVKQPKNVGITKKPGPHPMNMNAKEVNSAIMHNGRKESPKIQNKKEVISPKRPIAQEATSMCKIYSNVS